MGLYYTTYLCTGKFVNEQVAVVRDEIEVDGSIDAEEWQAGVVPLAEIESRAPRWKIRIVQMDGESLTGKEKNKEGSTYESNNKTNEKKESEVVDLFMKQSCFCTLTVPPSTGNRYILVQRGAKFEQISGDDDGNAVNDNLAGFVKACSMR